MLKEVLQTCCLIKCLLLLSITVGILWRFSSKSREPWRSLTSKVPRIDSTFLLEPLQSKVLNMPSQWSRCRISPHPKRFLDECLELVWRCLGPVWACPPLSGQKEADSHVQYMRPQEKILGSPAIGLLSECRLYVSTSELQPATLKVGFYSNA